MTQTDQNEEITLYQLSHVRTAGIHNEPENIVLQIGSGKDVRHYLISLVEFGRLVSQLNRDWLLLSQTATGHAGPVQ